MQSTYLETRIGAVEGAQGLVGGTVCVCKLKELQEKGQRVRYTR